MGIKLNTKVHCFVGGGFILTASVIRQCHFAGAHHCWHSYFSVAAPATTYIIIIPTTTISSGRCSTSNNSSGSSNGKRSSSDVDRHPIKTLMTIYEYTAFDA
jgi:hypothetical protein